MDILRERQLCYLNIYSLKVSPCAKYLAAATNAGSVAIFDINNGEIETGKSSRADFTQSKELSVLASKAYSLASTPHLLICGDSRGIIRSWRWDQMSSPKPSVASAIDICEISKGIQGCHDINSLTTNSSNDENSYLFAGCGDSNIYCFDLSCGKLVHTLQGHKDFVHQVVYSKAKRLLLSCSEDGTIKIWDMRTRQPINSIVPSERPGISSSGSWIGSLCIDKAGDWIAFGGGSQAGIYNIPTASFAASLEPAGLQVHATRFVDGKLLIGGQSPILYCYSVDGRPLSEIPLAVKGVFALETCLSNTILCVAGIGPKVDLIRHFAYRALSFSMS